MNALVPVSPVEQFKVQVLKPEVLASLPSHVQPGRFERNLVNALMTNPKLLKCDPRLVYREVSKIAALGLLLDPALGEAYLITGWNGKAQREEPQTRIGYRGLAKLARQSGEIGQIYAHEVYEADTFDVVLGDDKRLIHRPNYAADDRGRIVLYYAVAKYREGEPDFEIMNVKQVHDIRERSDGWRAFKAGKIKSTPWATDEVEMSKKTVIRRLLKRVPLAPDIADKLAEQLGREDEADFSDAAPRARIGARRAPPPPGIGRAAREEDVVDVLPQDPREDGDEVVVWTDPPGDDEAETGAVEPAQPQRRRAPPPPAHPADDQGSDDDEHEDEGPRGAVLDKLRAAAMVGTGKLIGALNKLSEDEASLITNEDRKALKDAAKAVAAGACPQEDAA